LSHKNGEPNVKCAGSGLPGKTCHLAQGPLPLSDRLFSQACSRRPAGPACEAENCLCTLNTSQLVGAHIVAHRLCRPAPSPSTPPALGPAGAPAAPACDCLCAFITLQRIKAHGCAHLGAHVVAQTLSHVAPPRQQAPRQHLRQQSQPPAKLFCWLCLGIRHQGHWFCLAICALLRHWKCSWQAGQGKRRAPETVGGRRGLGAGRQSRQQKQLAFQLTTSSFQPTLLHLHTSPDLFLQPPQE